MHKKAITEFQKVLAVIAIAMIVSSVLLSSDNTNDRRNEVTGGAVTPINIKTGDKAKFDVIYAKYPKIPKGTLEGLCTSESGCKLGVEHQIPSDKKRGTTGPLGITSAISNTYGEKGRYDPNTLEGSLEIAARYIYNEFLTNSKYDSSAPVPTASKDDIDRAIDFNKNSPQFTEALRVLREKGVPTELLDKLEANNKESIELWMSLQASLKLDGKAINIDGKVGEDTSSAIKNLKSAERVKINGEDYLYLNDGKNGLLMWIVTFEDRTTRIVVSGQPSRDEFFNWVRESTTPKFAIDPSTGKAKINDKDAARVGAGSGVNAYKVGEGDSAKYYIVSESGLKGDEAQKKDLVYNRVEVDGQIVLPDGKVMYYKSGTEYYVEVPPTRTVTKTEERTVQGKKETLTHTVEYNAIKGHPVRISTEFSISDGVSRTPIYMDLKEPNKDGLQEITSINGQNPVTYLSQGGSLGFTYTVTRGAGPAGPILEPKTGTLDPNSKIYIGTAGGLLGGLLVGQVLYAKVNGRFVAITCSKDANERCKEIEALATRATKIKTEEKIAAHGGYFNWFGDLLTEVQSAVRGYSFFSFLYSEPAPFVDDPNLLNILGGPTGELYGWTSFICAERATDIHDLGAAFATSLSGAFAHIEGEKATIIDFNASSGKRQPNLFLYKISFKVNPGIESRGCNMKFKVMISGISGRRSLFVDDGDGSDFVFKVEAGDDPVDFSGNNLIFAQSKNNFDKVSIQFLELTGNVVPCLDGVSEGEELTSRLIDNSPRELNFEDPCGGAYNLFMPLCWGGSSGGEGESTGKGNGGTTTGSQAGKRTGKKSGKPAVNI